MIFRRYTITPKISAKICFFFLRKRSSFLYSRKYKIHSVFVILLQLTEEAESQADLLNRRNRPKIVWLDLNKEPNPDFDEDPNIGLM